MAGRTLMTLDVREVLIRLRRGESIRATARELGLSRVTVKRYYRIAQEEGLLEGDLPATAELDRCLSARRPASSLPTRKFQAEALKPVITKLRERGVEAKTIHQRLCTDYGYTGSYSSIYRFIRSLEPTEVRGIVRIETPPGEEAQVDFGSAGEMIDSETGEVRKAWVFVMTLSCSRHQYSTLVFDQTIETWLRCHREAFEWFGGVPRRIVIDNLKAAIVKATFHDPVVQRSYREFAEHYGFLISPCRVRTPEHKGKVESGVRYVKRNALAGRDAMMITEANQLLHRWVIEVAGRRTHGTTARQPLEMFESIERTALGPLPPTPYDMGIWKQAKLHPDCHVVMDKAFYSAPHRLIGQRLWIRSNGRDVVIYHQHERVATHRWGRPGVRRTITAHYPPEKAMFLMATPAWCLRRAAEIGPYTAKAVEQLVGERPLDRLRTVQSVVRLADRYTPERVDAACRRALYFDDLRYATLKRILEKGLESESLPNAPPPPASRVQLRFKYARPGSEIFG